ncbi:MAG: urea ABC transporter permease subunit UrtC, partial [Patulibacter sp.]|nr:urea ABC transporter permease subunit UrtC [Patulibacter sp.]
PYFLTEFRLDLLAKFVCFAIVAIGVDVAWGYGGMLVLGQGVFFGLGGYAMAMHMKLADAGPGKVPDFMSWSGVEKLPAIWKPFEHGWFAVGAVLVIPMVVAFLLGSLVFRRRVRGAYFAILTQALASAFVILLVGQQGLTGGTNGLTNVNDFLGKNLDDSNATQQLYLLAVIVLGIAYFLARQLIRSRYGRLLIAVRDGEDRVRFLGYDPATVKTIAFTFSAGLAGLAGALFVPIVGIISPAMLGVVPSIEMVIWVALGGRATLVGAVAGALIVNYAKSSLSNEFPSFWTYFQGAMFIVVIAFLPKGVAGGLQSLRTTIGLRLKGEGGKPVATDKATEAPTPETISA